MVVAVSPEAEFVRSYTGKATNALVIDTRTDLAVISARPTMISVDNGIARSKITDVNTLGEEFNAGNNVTERKPVAAVTYGRNNLEIQALQAGFEAKVVTGRVQLPWKQKITRQDYESVPDPSMGYKIVKDEQTLATRMGAYGEAIGLTQQSFDSFSPSVPNSFAIGDGFARKFSADLIASGKIITMVPESAETFTEISEDSFQFLKIICVTNYSTGEIEIFYAPNASVDPEGSGYKPGEQEIVVNFDLAAISGCKTYDVKRISAKSLCQN
jgi:hypothetical protein